MKSDIEIARSTELMKIKQIAQNYGIPTDQVHHYGSYMAKVSEALIDEEKVKQSNLILVTAITPTKAGIGKTTTGASDGENQPAFHGRFPRHYFGA